LRKRIVPKLGSPGNRTTSFRKGALRIRLIRTAINYDYLKTFEEVRSALCEHKEELREEYKVKEIGVFGSYDRGEQKKRSDVDILVEFEKSSILTLLDFIGLENYLSDVPGFKVDLVEKHTLKPRIGKRVLEEVVIL
jgi:hypothetical protein